MKIDVQKLSRMLYILVMALLGVFYLMANFWKAVSGFWGLVMLPLALVALVLLMMGKNSIVRVIFGIFAVAQLPPLICWVKFYGIEFGILGHYLSVGWLGFAIHLAMALWGAFLFFRQKK